MKKSFLFVFGLMVIFAGCASIPVEVDVPNKISMSAVQKIGVIQIVPTDILLPVLPLVDAAAFNMKVKEVADKIKKIDEKNAGELTSFYAENIGQITGKEVLIIPNTIGQIPVKVQEAVELLKGTAKENGVDMIIGINHYMSVQSVRAFGINGQLDMRNDFYVFDAQGNLAGKGKIITPPTTWSGTDMIHYEVASKQFGYVENLVSEFFVQK